MDQSSQAGQKGPRLPPRPVLSPGPALPPRPPLSRGTTTNESTIRRRPVGQVDERSLSPQSQDEDLSANFAGLIVESLDRLPPGEPSAPDSQNQDTVRAPPLPPRSSRTSEYSGPYTDSPQTQSEIIKAPTSYQDSTVEVAHSLPDISRQTTEAHRSQSEVILRPALRECPHQYPILFSTYWYEFPGVTRACSKCYEDHIRSTSFASSFECIDEPAGTPRICRFNTPEVLQLWAQAVASNDFEELRAFTNSRAKIPDCAGKSGVKGSPDRRWFLPRTTDIPGFVACEACYHDHILATNFKDNFELHREAQGADQVWTCDLALDFVSRAISEYSKTRAWREFASAATYRMKLPGCPEKQLVSRSSRQWLQPKARIPGFLICETCYYDSAAASPMAQEFEYHTIPQMERYLLNICDMALLPSKLAWVAAVDKKNYRIWWNAAQVIADSPKCSGGDIKDGNWFVPSQWRGGFQICTACCAGLMKPFGFDRYLKAHRFRPGSVVSCSFSPTSDHLQEYIAKYVEAVHKGQFNILGDYATKFALLPRCPGLTAKANFSWYGNEEFLACPTCYEEVIKGTSLEHKLTLYNKELPLEYICSFSTPRMRNMWTEVCTKNDVTEFEKFARHRDQVYIQTVPEMQAILAMMKMRAQTQNTKFMASVIYHGASNIESAASSYRHHNYGNSTVGYGYDNSAGVEGAVLFNEASSMRVVNGNEFVRAAQLEAMWKEVE